MNRHSWKRIKNALLKPPVPVSPSDLFVSRVMQKIEQSEANKRPSTGWDWWWQIPAVGIGLTGLFLAFSTPPMESPISIECVLSRETAQSTSQKWISDQAVTPTEELSEITEEL